ncbi:hypothetical protein [Nocardioides mesophilus]|uniref:Uncharacterized protein n=1 Tax=Nocardioides mesophilus TaxID=433659 RepID=A0A7G9RFN3_9ACTN|nr:hypothetical protein [Nocardioides mesophilus]QNN54408.1 hypothetical protein H9L09_08825 [Nocardioides mesophilus]
MRTREWDQHVAPRLLEALPDGWSARNGHLSSVAAEGHLAWHISRQVSKSGGFEFHAVIQPLYVCSTVLVGNFDEILGHGVRGVRSFFTAATPDAVPVHEIVPLIQRYALPYFDRYGRDLPSFLSLTTGFARSRPEGRGTWTTEAWTAGAHSLLGDWPEARRSWGNCLTELAYFDSDVAPETRRLAAHGVDAHDGPRRSALVAWLLENERDMRVRWHLS